MLRIAPLPWRLAVDASELAAELGGAYVADINGGFAHRHAFGNLRRGIAEPHRFHELYR